MTGTRAAIVGRARRRRVIGVGEPADPPEGPLVAPADPDRQALALVRQRPEDEVVELVEPATERLGLPDHRWRQSSIVSSM